MIAEHVRLRLILLEAVCESRFAFDIWQRRFLLLIKRDFEIRIYNFSHSVFQSRHLCLHDYMRKQLREKPYVRIDVFQNKRPDL